MNTTPRHLGKYELLERLGYGGIAEVWKALDTQLQRFVAIKLLQPNLRDDPQFISRFQAEARMIASLHHPNIVQIHDFQVYQPEEVSLQEAPIAYMVMDYVEGQTLAGYIRATSNQGKFPSPIELVNLFTSISLAIDYAHRHNMIHRDIKPANILLDMRNTTINPMGEPILTDFGVAKLLSSTYMTLSEARLGTPLYTSPEQASGYPGNERSDLYALGVILYELTTGAMPFRGDTPHDVIMQHIYAMPPAPELINPTIPPALSHVIMRSLAKDPVRRYPSAAAMTIAIAEALHVPMPESLSVAFATKPDIPRVPTSFIPVADGDVTPQRRGGDDVRSSRPSVTPSLAQSGPEWVITSSGRKGRSSDQPPSSILKGERRRRFYITTLIGLVALLLVSAVGAIFYLPSIAAPPTITGEAFYVSSGQFNLSTAQGIADQVQIDLKNVPAPKPGDSYYAWLLGDVQPDNNIRQLGPPPIQTPVLLTNNLPVQNGTVHYLYDGSHTRYYDLLSATSRLLITEQPAGQNASSPSTNRSDWRYYAQLPQDQIPGDSPGFTAMTHFRHLFYDEPDLHRLGLNGGLDFWLTHNAEKIVELATSARDNWKGAQTTASNIALMNNLYISILDYLDGTQNVNVDLPPGTPVVADTLSAKVALITVSPAQRLQQGSDDLAGYVDHTIFHVGQVAKATDLLPQQRQFAANAISELQYAGLMLQGVRHDAVQLYQMRDNPAQIQQDSTRTLLDDMTTRAIYAYVGQVNPVTNQVRPAILQAHYDLERLSGLSISTNLSASI